MRPKNSFRLVWTALTRQQEVQASAVTLFQKPRSASDAWSLKQKWHPTTTLLKVRLEPPNTPSHNFFRCSWKNAWRLQRHGDSWQRKFVFIYPNMVSSDVPSVRLLFFHPTAAPNGGLVFLSLMPRWDIYRGAVSINFAFRLLCPEVSGALSRCHIDDWWWSHKDKWILLKLRPSPRLWLSLRVLIEETKRLDAVSASSLYSPTFHHRDAAYFWNL